MKFGEMYPTDRFYAADFKGKAWTLTFRAKDPVTSELLGKGSSSEKTLPIWHFDETPKKFPAVKTNGVCARAMFGDDSDAWAGRKITLYPAPDASGLADDGLCVRVKGSPELKSKLVFTAQIGWKKKTFTLVPTGTAKPPASASTAEGLTFVSKQTSEEFLASCDARAQKSAPAVDPVTGEVGDDDIGFDGPEASQEPAGDDLGPDGYTDAPKAEFSENGDIPGRGAKSAQGELA